jgi:hypothetical protein
MSLIKSDYWVFSIANNLLQYIRSFILNQMRYLSGTFQTPKHFQNHQDSCTGN